MTTSNNSLETVGQSNQELLGSAKRKRQFMIIGGLCVLAIVLITAIVLAVVLINNDDEPNTPNDPKEPGENDVSLEDILLGRLQAKRFNGTWISDDEYTYFDANGNYVLYSVKEKKSSVIVEQNSPLYEQFATASSYEFSGDKKYILITAQIVKLYRHSFLAIWQVYDIENKRLINVTVDNDNTPLYSLVKFAPSGASMVIVKDNNIYYKSSPLSPEIKITSSGTVRGQTLILNGVPDWVYEEEVFSTNSAIWFSPDGNKIAFIEFNATNVHSLPLPIYGLPGQYKYPQLLEVRYPKSGAPNPTVKLFTVDLRGIDQSNVNQKTELITPPTRLASVENLITSVAWANNEKLISVWMNRVQNQGLVYKCTVSACEDILNLDTNDGWIEFFTAPLFNGDGSEMTFIHSNAGYRHVMVLNIDTKNFVARTSGNYVVTEILKFNKQHNVIIYTANTVDDVKAQNVYAVNAANGNSVCLTCGLHTDHTYYNAEVSDDGNNLVILSNGPEIPRADLYTLNVQSLSNISLTNHIELEYNGELKGALAEKNMPKKIYDVIKLDEETEAYVMMLLPPNLDESKKYPMLIEVYGGPDSSSVTNRFNIEWGTYLASSLDIVYAKIDGRGSGLRSDKHLHTLYKNLGTVEVDDQVRTASKLVEKYRYLDAARVAIWGWSYGGYVSGMALMRDNDVFKCATSVAPVTDWALYDTIYTERYMLLPRDNPSAYNVSRMMNFVENIRKHNKMYMLVHGTLDDNVHFQQGMILARTLERADIQFKEITYPDEDHSLAGVRPHLYHSLERFFKQCFGIAN